MALSIQNASDLWELDDYLDRSRKLIASRYDYRYSQLPMVLGQLVQHGLITPEDLQGLAANKLGYVRLVMEERNDHRRGKREIESASS